MERPLQESNNFAELNTTLQMSRTYFEAGWFKINGADCYAASGGLSKRNG